jgi:hypothetical protein
MTRAMPTAAPSEWAQPRSAAGGEVGLSVRDRAMVVLTVDPFSTVVE